MMRRLCVPLFLLAPVALQAAPLECEEGHVFLEEGKLGVEFVCKNISDTSLREISGWRGEYLVDGKRRSFQRDVPLYLSQPLSPEERRTFRLTLDLPDRGRITDIRMLDVYAPRAAWQVSEMAEGVQWECRDIRRVFVGEAMDEARFQGELVNRGDKPVAGLKKAVFVYGNTRETRELKFRKHRLPVPLLPGERQDFNITVPMHRNESITRFDWKEVELEKK